MMFTQYRPDRRRHFIVTIRYRLRVRAQRAMRRRHAHD